MDTQIGLLGALALDDDGSAFNSYNLMLTYLLLYLANVISHDFFIHFDTSFSPSARLKMSREKSVSREKPLHGYWAVCFPRDISSNTPKINYDLICQLIINWISWSEIIIDESQKLKVLILRLSTAVSLFGFIISLRFTSIIAASLYSETVIRENFHCHNIIVLFI